MISKSNLSKYPETIDRSLLLNHEARVMFRSDLTASTLFPALPSSLVAFCLFAATSSCASHSDQAPSSDPAGTGGSSAGQTAAIPCDDGPIDLDGTFALVGRLSFTFSSQQGGAVTVCPTDQTSEGIVLGLLEVDQQASQRQPHITARICSIALPVISAMVGTCDPRAENMVYAGIEFPSALLDAFASLSPAKATAKVQGTDPGARFVSDALSFGVGTRKPYDQSPVWLSDAPGCGAMDIDKGRGVRCEGDCVSSCDELTDDDSDGKPGVTVHVCGYTNDDKQQGVTCQAQSPSTAGSTLQGTASMTIHVSGMQASGKAMSSCEIEGRLTAGIHYQVVGADLYLANAPISVTSAILSLPHYQVNDEKSRFRLVRVDGSHGAPDWGLNLRDPVAACHTVIAHQNELQ